MSSKEELISSAIDYYAALQRIKAANGGNENIELEYELKVIVAKLSSYGVNVKDITRS